MSDIPKKYDHNQSEEKWMSSWDEKEVYRWDESVGRGGTFVVDTPPPTVSGSLHVGHVFSYTHTDIIVRFQRMLGKNIMYPMGWDDNGLPTERRVQNKFGINCNPHLAYDPDWRPKDAPAKGVKNPEEVSRQNFIEACGIVTEQDEKAFEVLWRRLGLSIDWPQTYATIDDHCRSTSQASFLDLVEKGRVYNSESPTMWDVGFQTALAQADLEDREIKGAYHDVLFGVEGGGEFTISTTRPELLPACIAVVAHPSDERYKDYFGKKAITPLFHMPVPIVPSDHADPEKGTGIMMVCTFGDAADVDWWKTSKEPIRQIFSKNGRVREISFREAPFESSDPEKAQAAYAELVGKSPEQARRRIAELLAEPGSAVSGSAALVGEPKLIEHPVKFYEKGDRPIEFITTRQWFVKILDVKDELLAQGEKIQWHPSHMRARYDHWVEGLAHDWCISRQRFFGVPFPVWYPVSDEGTVNYEAPIYANAAQLPVDPLLDCPEGFDESQRGKPGGFVGDPDVMDTWATSSLTPQIVSHWGKDEERHQKLFPMDMRPQSHEIIRTWAFYTIVKAWIHDDEIPWRNVVISGWILDPDRKKMSKSKGNVVTPQHLLEQYSSDAVRYWAGRARLGVDTAFDEQVFKSGRKLSTKLFNASRFALMQINGFDEFDRSKGLAQITNPLDRAMVAELCEAIEQSTRAFEKYDYAAALSAAEGAFWYFCDNYIELCKGRAYEGIGEQRASAVQTLEWSLGVFIRLFAPFLPYVTEEIWSWQFAQNENQPTVHRASWPKVSEAAEVEKGERGALAVGVEVLDAIRQAKSEAQMSLKTEVTSLEVAGSQNNVDLLKSVLEDVSRAGRVIDDGATLAVGEAEEGSKFSISIQLAQEA